MNTIATGSHQPWNKGKLVGQKAPLRLSDAPAFAHDLCAWEQNELSAEEYLAALLMGERPLVFGRQNRL